MSQTTSPVDRFVNSVGKRIDSHQNRNIASWALLIGGAVMLILALCYVWPGYQVPWVLYPAVLVVALIASVIACWWLRSSDENAASFADRFFNFKNAVQSCLRFARDGKQGGFYQLQAQQTEELVQSVSLEQIRYRPAWRIILPGLVLVAVAVSLGFKPASPSVLAKIEQEKATLAMTAAANQELEELVKELEQSAEDEEERKLLQPNKLREWVDDLKETSDIREAKRQYAKMEMRLNRAAEAIRQRKEEKLLDKAAEELRKDLDTAELSKDLKHKKYEKAADKLKDLKPGEKSDQKFNPGELSKSRKELAKLKAAAKRMAAAARKTGSNSKLKTKQKFSDRENASDGDPAEAGNEEADDGELSELIEELEEAVEDLDREFEEIELAEGSGEQDLEDNDGLDDAQAAVKGKLDELGDRLKKMASRRKARSKLNKLSKKCAQCQSGASQARRNGGKRAGEESEDSFRDERDERIDNGQNAKLKGIKGSGPSLTRVESADDGDGTSNRRSEAKLRDFKRQFESFVDREDVPQDLKNGVKEYFTNIHEHEEK